MNADGSSSMIRGIDISGIAGIGKLFGKAPNREKIVSTGNEPRATTAEVTPTATIKPGNFGARADLDHSGS